MTKNNNYNSGRSRMLEYTIPFQQQLVTQLPKVENNKEFTEYCELLNQIDTILSRSGVEKKFISCHVSDMLSKKQKSKNNIHVKLSGKEVKRYRKDAVTALRCNIVGIILKQPLRGLSMRLAESPVLRQFCQLDDLVKIKVPSKSKLGDYRNFFPEEMIEDCVNHLLEEANSQRNVLGLVAELDSQDVYIDCTCWQSNIHFPVDWLLLRDAVRTIIGSILVIRKHGLRHRIPEPKSFLHQINTLCIAMSQCRRKKDASKIRKQLLRKMKKISQVVECHGMNYINLLETRREESDLTKYEAQQIIDRIKNILDQLPAAREQAHRRIISGVTLLNSEKILSLYDKNVCVIKRGKSNAEVEFGNELFLAEQKQGLIVDWKLYDDQPPADTNKLPEFIKRILSKNISIANLSSDRGFFSEPNSKLLEEQKIKNFLCPKDPLKLKLAMEDNDFRLHQCRRAQTEARVGILKNCFAGNPAKSREIKYRNRHVAWAILTHNLWVLARLPKNEPDILAKTA